MNPFDFHGPQFLVFYLLLSVLLNVLVRKYIAAMERQRDVPRITMSDPYQIAYMRAGASEAIRIAIVSLIDRRLLRMSNISGSTTVEAANAHSADIAQRPIEKAILRFFEVPSAAYRAFSDKKIVAACQEYQDRLGRAGLVRIPQITQARLVPVLLSGAVLAGIAIAKIMIALERGHRNVAFLTILSIVSVVFLGLTVIRHRTALGDDMLKDLNVLFGSLYARRKSLQEGGRTNEAALVAAVFGISAVSSVFYYAKTLFPQSSSSGCGGSSCGGGSGCGGGGGCGGCGS